MWGRFNIKAWFQRWRKLPEEDDGEEVAWKLRRCLEGWTCWQYHPPPRVLIQAWRFEWPDPVVMKAWDINPMENVVGLYWKLTGIGAEQTGR